MQGDATKERAIGIAVVAPVTCVDSDNIISGNLTALSAWFYVDDRKIGKW
jgi:hypothetical protein